MRHTWSANGNLLSDGASTYTYDHARVASPELSEGGNRLTSVVQGANTYSFAYNGLGDRLQQMENGAPNSYTLDLNVGLTQVLEDGANAYFYGRGRVGEQGGAGWAYHHGDALGSLRQLTDSESALTLAKSYAPYGSLLQSSWDGASHYGFTGEWTDATGLIYLTPLKKGYHNPPQIIKNGVRYEGTHRNMEGKGFVPEKRPTPTAGNVQQYL